ncbi:MAG TPA: murein transglycosylase A [Stellaceae bacterium]|nr:murein transglycosylase A [Stellaceae bacterium]
MAWRRLAPLLLLLWLAACAAPPPPRLTLEPARFDNLPGWQQDQIGHALAAFRRSCAAFAKRDASAPSGPAALHLTAGDWHDACGAAAAVGDDDAAARGFFERYFTPYLAGNNGSPDGLFTGYYEPLLHGARQRGGPYQTPILRRPPDLVSVDLGRFRPAWHGERIAGRVVNGALVPYATRAAIEHGALDAQNLALLWVDNPVDAFFLQVQGSGRVELPDGSMVGLGYDGQNGQTYVAIGRLLIARGILTPETTSLQSIRAWIAAHPSEGAALMDENPSYVFFRETGSDGPIGGEGVVLTPRRSLAVDAKFIPLGAPIYLAASGGDIQLERLMVAQDVGGAISGPVRGDVFWGFGADAETKAGAMRAHGRYYLLLPKSATLPIAVAARRG